MTGRASKRQCCVEVWHNFSHSLCSRNATVKRNGKWYCKQHDPVVKEAKDAARRAKWAEESKISHEKFRRQKACLTACEGISTEALEAGVVKKMLDTLRCVTGDVGRLQAVVEYEHVEIVGAILATLNTVIAEAEKCQ